jgi:plastocyanin
MRRLLIAAVVVVLSACSGGGGSHEVTMPAEHVFEPATITIKAGESVTWTNASNEQHTVTADESALPDGATYFSSGDAAGEKAANDDLAHELILPDGEYSHTFETPGRYSYYCILHLSDGMKGTVVVEK